MAFTTISLRPEVARKLKAAKEKGETYSDLFERLLENQPAKTVGEWLESLAPLEGVGVFTADERKRLRSDQKHPRRSSRKRRRAAA